ncbi:MAG: hypothetical protein IPO06_00835 [Leptospiraceae bacterium]|nr:hypothetical protein [Leptospiraceae bacterium]MBK9497923.1 hypothetical protein [Leptospiraceae bacterium]
MIEYFNLYFEPDDMRVKYKLATSNIFIILFLLTSFHFSCKDENPFMADYLKITDSMEELEKKVTLLNKLSNEDKFKFINILLPRKIFTYPPNESFLFKQTGELLIESFDSPEVMKYKWTIKNNSLLITTENKKYSQVFGNKKWINPTFSLSIINKGNKLEKKLFIIEVFDEIEKDEAGIQLGLRPEYFDQDEF